MKTSMPKKKGKKARLKEARKLPSHLRIGNADAAEYDDPYRVPCEPRPNPQAKLQSGVCSVLINQENYPLFSYATKDHVRQFVEHALQKRRVDL
jgi:hypothetical protein